MTRSSWTSARWRAFFELVTTVLVACAAVAVLTQTVRNWRAVENQFPQATQRPAPTPPIAPIALESAAFLGNRGAKIVLIGYSDFQCPFCESFSREVWPTIKEKYVEPGKVLVAFRHLPLAIHQFARNAAIAAECAGTQGKFWEMHDLLFENQQELYDAAVQRHASAAGLDARIFGACLTSDTQPGIDRDEGSAKALGIAGTPTFLIGVLQDDDMVKVTHILPGAQLGRLISVLDESLRTSRLAD